MYRILSHLSTPSSYHHFRKCQTHPLLTTGNTVLVTEVEKMQTAVRKDEIPGARDLPLFRRVAQQSRQLLQLPQEISEEAQKPLELEHSPPSSLKRSECTLLTLAEAESKHEEPSVVCMHKRKDFAVSELEAVLAEQAVTMTLLQRENAELHQQKNCLSMELSNMREKFEQLEDQLKLSTSSSSESCLRSALCDSGSSMDDLKRAIDASEALLNEAKREHANKKFRAKRAALEGLEVAAEEGEETSLAAAIVAARQADVDAVDLEKPEEKLKVLRAMTREQHAAKAARELLQKQKATAFALVKKDDVMKFKELIEEVGKDVSWCDWRDPLGRTICRCAKDLRALRVQEFIAQLGVGDKQPEEEGQRPTVKQILQQFEQRQQKQEQRCQKQQKDIDRTHRKPVDERTEDARVVEQNAGFELGEGFAHACVGSNLPTPCLPDDSIAISKSKAFRAAAQDDVRTFNEIIDSVPADVWSKWENRAGKTLLALSEERGSAAVHLQVAKALGIVKQIKRETFEEREAVWVYTRGDIQPKRATVLAATVEDAEMVPVEYWEGSEAPTRVSRSSIRKMFV